MKKDKSMCIGCHNDFYNGNNPMGIKECWSYERAKAVKRYCIGWWTPMDKKENFWAKTTLNCYADPGRTAYLEKLPAHLV